MKYLLFILSYFLSFYVGVQAKDPQSSLVLGNRIIQEITLVNPQVITSENQCNYDVLKQKTYLRTNKAIKSQTIERNLLELKNSFLYSLKVQNAFNSNVGSKANRIRDGNVKIQVQNA